MRKNRRGFHLLLGIFLVIVTCSAVLADNNTNNTNETKKRFVADVTIQEGSHADYNLRVETAKPIIVAPPGKETKFKLFLTKNPEGLYIHDIKVKITNTEFGARLINSYVEEFKNEEMYMVDVIITIPEDLSYGDYPLKVNVSGREFLESSYNMLTVIRVENKSYFLPIIMTLFIILIIAYATYAHIQSYQEVKHIKGSLLKKLIKVKYLIKISRFTAWIGVVLLIIYFITGYSMTGKAPWFPADVARSLHFFICIPAIIFLLAHTGIQGYFAMKRWGWIKKNPHHEDEESEVQRNKVSGTFNEVKK